MIHDQILVDRLSRYSQEKVDALLFRATRASADPLARSISGGRWAPPPDGDPGFYALYTCYERDGAIAEVVSFLAEQTPIPGPRPIKVTQLAVTASKVVRLSRPDLESLGVDFARYGERDYPVTQKIGAALSFLGVDALIAPSARWRCDNFVIFMDNHALAERLEVLHSDEVEWRAWARANGLLPG